MRKNKLDKQLSRMGVLLDGLKRDRQKNGVHQVLWNASGGLKTRLDVAANRLDITVTACINAAVSDWLQKFDAHYGDASQQDGIK